MWTTKNLHLWQAQRRRRAACFSGDVSHVLIASCRQRKVRRLSDIHHGTWNKSDTFTRTRDSACLHLHTHTYSTGGLCVNHSCTFVQVSQNIWLILSFYGISFNTINRKGGGCQSVRWNDTVIFNLIADTTLLSQDCTLIQEAIFSQITFRFLSLKILKHVCGGGRGGSCCWLWSKTEVQM